MRATAAPALPASIAIPQRLAADRLAAIGAPMARESVLDNVGEAGLQALQSYRAMPSFLYPAVSGTTAAEKALILQTLDQLPMKDVSSISTIKMVGSLSNPSPDSITLGVTRVGTGDMQLSRSALSLHQIQGVAGPTGNWAPSSTVNPHILRTTLVHEIGHGLDFQGGVPHMLLGGPTSSHGPWGKPPFVTDYASTSAREDFAESHAYYQLGPHDLDNTPDATGQDLKTMSPAKYQAMRHAEQPNFMERLVAQKPFRDTGRLIGEWTSAAPLVRTGLSLASQMTAFALIVNGAGEVFGGVSHSQGGEAVRGALDLGAGLGLGLTFANPLCGPAALALLGARSGLDRADREAASRGERAAGGAETAAALGGAVGGGLGGVLGPLGGTWLGYEVAGPVGGVAGLLAGALVGFRGGSMLGAHAGLALAGK